MKETNRKIKKKSCNKTLFNFIRDKPSTETLLSSLTPANSVRSDRSRFCFLNKSTVKSEERLESLVGV